MIESIRYHGGKSCQRTGGWIASKLPFDKRSVYIETHAGMLGVLLSRPRANSELVNDLNSRLCNFWRVLIDDGDALIDRVSNTPHSRELFDGCRDAIDEGSDLERAWKYFVVISQSLFAGDGDASWFRSVRLDSVSPPRYDWRLEDIRKRILRVQVDNCPALDILEKFADWGDAVIYVDPPYADTHNTPYTESDGDRDEMRDLLMAQRGQVAVSGYGSEWDSLGWVRHEMVKRTTLTSGKLGNERIEVLWCNYELEPKLL